MSPDSETFASNTSDHQSRLPGRRAFLSNAAVVAASIASAGLLTPVTAMAVSPALTFAQIPGTGDVKVLNFALALEVLSPSFTVRPLHA